MYGNGIDDVLVMITTTGEGKKRTEGRYFYQKNQLGSITAITDDKGKVVEEYKYDEFGKAYVKKEKKDEWKILKKSDIGNVRLFTGREYGKEIGLYYYRARYYSADLGRFISRDPIRVRDNVNLYSYVSNNPLRYTDPMGMEKKFVIAYDYYSELKSEIYNFNGGFDLGFLLMNQTEQVDLLNQYNDAASLARELHYNRNQLNINLPGSIEEAQKEGWYTVIADYHQYGAPEGNENIKYVSQDGHREVIFSYLDGNIDNSIENMGTYNFFAPDFDFEGLDHLKYDVDPWNLWGNGLNDKQINN